MTYYLYHIPGKKIGVTKDIQHRLIKRQGYRKGEYEILAQSNSLNSISELEAEYQQAYGYEKDIITYKQLVKRIMRINVTDQTSTFPCPLNKLKGQLMDNTNHKWQTPLGQFEVTANTIQWILENARASSYTNERCYIYNKAYAEEFLSDEKPVKEVEDFKYGTLFPAIRDWAKERGIYEKGDSKTQYLKLSEEFGELGKALLNKDRIETIDAIGDMIVVLTNLAHLEDTTIENCIEAAYNVIKQRTGKMINGTFVKDEK